MTLVAPAAPKLFATLNSLPEPTRIRVVALLNQRLADAIDLQAQCKQAHWNVKGPQFIALHKLFDEVHEAVAGHVDLIAERVVQLGGVAAGTVRLAAQASELEEYPLVVGTGMDHVRLLAAALGAFGSRIAATIRELDGLGDAGSTDLCTEVSRGIDQWLWFVEAHRQTH